MRFRMVCVHTFIEAEDIIKCDSIGREPERLKEIVEELGVGLER